MREFSFDGAANALGLSTVVDVFDHEDLFETLDNVDVLKLSRLGGAAGFSGINAIMKSTGVSHRRLLRKGVAPIDLAVAVCRKLEPRVCLLACGI